MNATRCNCTHEVQRAFPKRSDGNRKLPSNVRTLMGRGEKKKKDSWQEIKFSQDSRVHVVWGKKDAKDDNVKVHDIKLHPERGKSRKRKMGKLHRFKQLVLRQG